MSGALITSLKNANSVDARQASRTQYAHMHANRNLPRVRPVNQLASPYRRVCEGWRAEARESVPRKSTTPSRRAATVSTALLADSGAAWQQRGCGTRAAPFRVLITATMSRKASS